MPRIMPVDVHKHFTNESRLSVEIGALQQMKHRLGRKETHNDGNLMQI